MDFLWIKKLLDPIFLTKTTTTTLMSFDTIEINLVCASSGYSQGVVSVRGAFSWVLSEPYEDVY